MVQRVAHRGPDEEGFLFGHGIGLGHRRLSIIDLFTGRQPIGNEDGSIQVVFNGEIYNFPDLRRELEERGHRFSTRTDTEVLVHLYEEKGEDLLRDLNGMFAFALWDERRRKLLLARDRIGIKPLYYAFDGERFAFASEPKALLELPWIDSGLDLEGLSLFLSYDFIPAPHSIYRGIRKIPPGYFLAFKDGNLHLQRYWDLDLRDRLPEGLTEEELCDLLWGEFCRAVKTRLISDVPLGVLLSGGIDSSSVVAALRHEGVKDLKTFSVGFEDPSFDESPYFRQVARLFETDHHEEILSPKSLLDILPEVASILDEPMADASIMPTYLL
ncbi:MAG: asparagine synthase (glutamine-hydrolyzing), partial [Deltaproteobacteria bacterium]